MNRVFRGVSQGMIRIWLLWAACFIAGSATTVAQKTEPFTKLLTPEVKAKSLSPPKDLDRFVKDDKLSLRLDDAILLALENNSSVRINEAQVESQKFMLLGSYKPFDPLVQGVVNANRYSYPGYTQLQGVGDATNSTQDVLSQSFTLTYNQTFSTGTNVIANFNAGRTSTNSSFFFYNPYYSSTLGVQFTQPLLRNFGKSINTAPIVIARRTLQQSRAGFEAQVNSIILQVVTQYWAVVQARDSYDVQMKSQDAADASYKHDKRALELGALPPLDIYRSQAEVAARKLTSIQGEYALKQAEEALRLTIGADVPGADKSFAESKMKFDLTESPSVAIDAIPDVNEDSMLTRALAERPEVSVADLAVANDEVGIKVAQNGLKPDLELNGFYQSTGAGGNIYDLNTGKLLTPGGLGTSFNQTFGFGFPGYGGSLTLNLPLHNRGAKATLGTALVTRHRDQLTGRETREQIVNQVRIAAEQLEEAKLALKAGETSLDLAKKSLAADQRKYELGAETNFFVLDSQTKLAQAELNLLQTQVNYQTAKATADYTTGDLLSTYKLKIAELEK
jgi:outer membrane protein